MGSATEINNAVLAHVAETAAADAWIAISAVEHPCVLGAAERYFGGRVERILVDAHGRLELSALRRSLQTKPIALVAVMAANNETGVLQPVAAVASLCRDQGVPFLCDASQWLGKLPVAGLPRADYISCSGHKLGGPRGVGALILGSHVLSFRGRVGGQQENSHQAGTEDVAGIAAMTAAFEAHPTAGWSTRGRDQFLASLRGSEFSALGRAVERLPNTVSLIVPRHPPTRWIARLEKHGWIVASGSACSTGKGGVSHVLLAMGLDLDQAGRVLRLSGGLRTSVDEWKQLREALDLVLEELDRASQAGSLGTVIKI